MPGPVVHSIIAEKLPEEFQGEQTDVARAMDNHRRELVYGAQGPDPFFFNLNDLVGKSVAKYLIDFQNFKGDLSYSFYQFREPLVDVSRKINNAANDAVLEASKHSDLIDQIKNLIAQLSESMFLASKVTNGYLKKTILDNADPFGLYVSPLQTCGRTKDLLEGAKTPLDGVGGWKEVANLDDWWWFDLLHSRRTGDFVTELLDIATGRKPGDDGGKRQRDRLLSYAVGYLSHLSADVVGHAYVNSIVGGPYRLSQAQRHTAQEKIMDIWAYNNYYNETGFLEQLNQRDDRYYLSSEVVDSGMHKNFLFTAGKFEPRQWERNPENALNKSRKKPINATVKIPDVISSNFVTATDRAYPESRFGKLTADEVDLAYRGWYSMFKNATTTFSPFDPSELPGDVRITEKLKQELEDAKKEAKDVADAAEDVGDALTHDGGGDIGNCFPGGELDNLVENAVDCLEDAAESVKNYVSNLAESVANLFKEAAELVYSVYEIADAAAAVPLRALNYKLRQAYEKLWASYTRLLKLVTAIGFSYCYWDDLSSTNQLKHLYDPRKPDATNSNNSPKNTIVKPNKNEAGFPRYGMKIGHGFTPAYNGVLDGLENEGHLIVPTTDIEPHATIPGPDEYGTNTPEVFIDDPNDELAHPFDDERESPLWEWIAAPEKNDQSPTAVDSETPVLSDYRTAAASKDNENFTAPVLGDAVSLTLSLYQRYLEYREADGLGVPNLNMSGDRAIGFPTWANKNGCRRDGKQRDRWKSWHGTTVPWLDTPIDPVFVPKVPRTEWDEQSQVPNDVFY